MPEPHIPALLRHEDTSVAVAVASAVWEAEPKGQIPQSIREPWRAAVVDSVENEHWLPKAFDADPALAFDWLLGRIRSKSSILSSISDVTCIVDKALEKVSHDQRRVILSRIPPDYAFVGFLDRLIFDDNELYTLFVSDTRFRPLHLCLLTGRPFESSCDESVSNSWTDRAILTLNAGYSEDEVSRATIGDVQSWSGNESDMWTDWIQRFEPLVDHGDRRVRRVVSKILKHVKREYDKALHKESEESIFGETE